MFFSALTSEHRPCPEFVAPVPIRKTRAGLQFTCASPALGVNACNLKDVWVCNSDGYVGQVCVLSLQPEPNVISCNGVCNARILCIASVPSGVSRFVSLTMIYKYFDFFLFVRVMITKKVCARVLIYPVSSSTDYATICSH